MLRGDFDISIRLNIDTFIEADSQALGGRLSAETDLRVESGQIAYSSAPGTVPPDVVIHLLSTVAPAATSMLLEVLSAALWDTLKAAFSRPAFSRQMRVSEAEILIVTKDEDGRTLRMARARTGDPEIIKDLFRQALEDDETCPRP